MSEAASFVFATLAALTLGLSTIASAAGVAQALGPRRGLPLLATLVLLAAALLTFEFHALLLAGAFRLLPALALSLGVLAAVHGTLVRSRARWRAAVWSLPRELGRLLRALRPPRDERGFVAVLLVIAALLISARAALLPPLAWDTLTSHAVKAALWVQGGRVIHFPAPGGWGFSQFYMGGTDLLMAWAMLPFRSDVACGLIEVRGWFACFGSHLLLARELGLRSRDAIAAAVAVAFLPALAREVGSGYAEIGLGSLLALGLAFALRAERRRSGRDLALALLAFGLAAGAKLTALPVLVLAWPLLGTLVLRRLRLAGPLVAGSVLAAAAIVPWLVVNVRETGALLAYTPVQVGHWTLGITPPALAWYMNRPELPAPPAWFAELAALRQVFRLPWADALHLDAVTLVPLALAPWGLVRLARHRPLAAWCALAVAGSVLAGYAAPGFRVVRLLWAVSSARFLLPVAALGIVLGLLALPARSGARRALSLTLLLAALVHALIQLAGMADFERGIVAATALALGIALAGACALLSSRRFGWPRAALAVSLLLAGALALRAARGAIRPDALERSVVLHDVPRHWVDAARTLDEPLRPHTIAVTSGPVQNADNWFLYAFLGSRFQNTLVYVPVRRDGRVVDFSADGAMLRAAEEPVWRERLARGAVTHVMSFPPASAEIAWMERAHDRFERLSGDGTSWGLYALRRATALPDSSGP